MLIPAEVKREILAGGTSRIGIKEFERATWFRVLEIQDPMKVKLLHELDRGEAEVIVLAQEQGIQTVCIDEKVARMHARVLGLTVIGTLGVLLRAKKQGLLSEIRPHLEKIRKAGIYIQQGIIEGILLEAGESS